MNELQQPGPLRRILGGLWRGLTRVRVALSNLVFLALILVIFVAFRDTAPPPLPGKAALLLNPAGSVVEERSRVEPLGLFLSEPAPEEREVLLDDMIDAVLIAKDDPKITALVMELDQLQAMGTSKTGEVAEAIAEFRGSGKPVIAWNDALSQGQYLLASEADEVIIHPMGSVLLNGFANYQWYFADALEKLMVNVHVFRAGEFKSIAENFQRNDMSEGEKAISRRWLDAAWAHYTTRVEARRELSSGAVDAYVNDFADAVKSNGGDLARTALQVGLVDKLMSRSEANDYIASVVGASNDDGQYEAVEFETYMQRKRLDATLPGGKPRVAVIAARGDIRQGRQPAGTIGSDSLGWLIHDAAADPDVAAIVLRIDSPGGGTFASELVRRKILEARETGKPVVVSMSSIATSGGYWIASAADQIWANPTTLTGSIGVFLAVPTFENLLEEVGVNTDGVGTTRMAGAFRGDLALKPAVSSTYQAAVDHYHRLFVDVIAEGRPLARDDVRALANGGVYLGEDAAKLGLVDHLGGGRDAVAAAAKLAGLEAGEYVPVRFEEPPSAREAFLRQLAGSLSRAMGTAGILGQANRWQATLRSVTAPLVEGLRVLERLDDPNGVYAHCLVCAVP